MGPLTNLAALHDKHQVTLRSPAASFDFTVNQSDNSMIAIEAFEQRNLVHVGIHRLRICLVERDTLQSEHFLCIVHDAVYT